MEYIEMERVFRPLVVAFRLEDSAELRKVWWTHLMEFDADTVFDAVMSYINSERRTPTVADIVSICNTLRNSRRSIPSKIGKTVKCPYCKDLGLIRVEYETGVTVGRPCTECPKGKERYPWYFKTEEEKQAWREQEAKKGRAVPIPHEASEAFYRAYVFGEGEDSKDRALNKVKKAVPEIAALT